MKAPMWTARHPSQWTPLSLSTRPASASVRSGGEQQSADGRGVRWCVPAVRDPDPLRAVLRAGFALRPSAASQPGQFWAVNPAVAKASDWIIG